MSSSKASSPPPEAGEGFWLVWRFLGLEERKSFCLFSFIVFWKVQYSQKTKTSSTNRSDMLNWLMRIYNEHPYYHNFARIFSKYEGTASHLCWSRSTCRSVALYFTSLHIKAPPLRFKCPVLAIFPCFHCPYYNFFFCLVCVVFLLSVP